MYSKYFFILVAFTLCNPFKISGQTTNGPTREQTFDFILNEVPGFLAYDSYSDHLQSDALCKSVFKSDISVASYNRARQQIVLKYSYYHCGETIVRITINLNDLKSCKIGETKSSNGSTLYVLRMHFKSESVTIIQKADEYHIDNTISFEAVDEKESSDFLMVIASRFKTDLTKLERAFNRLIELNQDLYNPSLFDEE